MEKLYFLQAFFPDCSHHEQAGWEQKWSLISTHRAVWQTVYILVTNLPRPGPLLRERPVQLVTWDQGLWAGPCLIWVEAPLWTHLGTAELGPE